MAKYEDLDHIDENEDQEVVYDEFDMLEEKEEKNRQESVEQFEKKHPIIGGFMYYSLLFAGYLAEMARVVVATLMGKNAHLEFKRVKENLESRDDMKRKIEENTKKETEPTPQKEKTVEPIKSNEVGEPNHEFNRDREDEILKHMDHNVSDPEITNGIIDICFNTPQTLKVFEEIGLYPVNTPDSRNIHLFSTHAEMDMKRILCMSKEDFMKCDGESLAAVLYSYHKGKGDAKEMLTAALQAAIAQTKIGAQIYSEQLDNLPVNNRTSIGYLEFKTPEMDTAFVSVEITNSKDTAEVVYQGKPIGVIRLDEPVTQSVEKVINQAMKEYTVNKERKFTINDIALERKGKNVLEITKDGNTEKIFLKQETDLQKLNKIFQDKAGMSKEKAKASALIIGAIGFPGMKKSYDAFGFELNPFTSERKKTGDLFIDKNTGDIKRFSLELNDGKVTETSAVIQKAPDYWSGINLSEASSHVEKEMSVKFEGNALDEYILPVTNLYKEGTLDEAVWEHGYVAFQTVKERSVLDGMDISQFKFKEEREKERKSQEHQKEKKQNKSEQNREKDNTKKNAYSKKEKKFADTTHESKSNDKSEVKEEKSFVPSEEDLQKIAEQGIQMRFDDFVPER